MVSNLTADLDSTLQSTKNKHMVHTLYTTSAYTAYMQSPYMRAAYTPIFKLSNVNTLHRKYN